jgi:tetratricopeptide (TPR) repeat protein/TolB-like protein
LETICAKCLDREPQMRYRSAAELAEDLERWLKGRPIVARPISPPTHAWRWCKRNPILASTGLICFLIAALAGVRQVHSRQLERQLSAQNASRHSIQINRILDLDSAQASEAWTSSFAAQFEKELTAIGPNIVRVREDIPNSDDLAVANLSPAETPARALLSATIRSIDNKVRLSAQVLDANTGAVLLRKIIEAGPNVAPATAAKALAPQTYQLLSESDLSRVIEPVTDPGLLDSEARNFIQSGTTLANRRAALDLDRSISCLEHALELEPNSSVAHAALAKALCFKAAYQSSKEPLSLSLVHAGKAVELDPGNAEAHLALAAVFFHLGQMGQAIEEAHSALERSRYSWGSAGLLCNIYKATGRPDQALAWFLIRKRQQSGAGETDAGIADCLTYLLRDEEAETYYDHYWKLHPEQPEGWMGLCRLYLLNQRFEEARKIYQRERKGYVDFSYARQMAAQVELFGRNLPEAEALYGQLFESDPDGGGAFYGCISYRSALGYLRLVRHDESAQGLLQQARQTETALLQDSPSLPDTLYRLAAIESCLVETDSALSHLADAANAGWIDFRSLQLDPRFDSIRGTDSYNKTVEAMKKRVTSLQTAAASMAEPRVKTKKKE